MNTATLITSLPKSEFPGDAKLYLMEPPLEENSFVVVSATYVLGRPETYLFSSNEQGKVSCWTELAGSQKDTISHGDVLADLGYEIVLTGDTTPPPVPHSPLPWHAVKSTIGAKGIVIASMDWRADDESEDPSIPATKEEAEANAAFIVTACNAHASLVEALKETVDRLERVDALLLAHSSNPKECDLGEITRARALLAKLK